MKQNKQQIEVRTGKYERKIRKQVTRLNIMYVKSKEKVAYYYENINSGLILSFNENITFYAASTIKILPVLYLYETKENLNQTIKIEEKDVKRGCGKIKEEVLPKEYRLKDLIFYSIKYSDNTAYISLINWIGKEKLQEYSKKIGALHEKIYLELHPVMT